MKTALPSYDAAALSLGQVQRHASRTHTTATRVRPTGAAAPTTLRARQEHRQTTRPHCSGGRNSLSEILSTPIIVVPSLNNLPAVRYLMYNAESIAISEFNLRANNAHENIKLEVHWTALQQCLRGIYISFSGVNVLKCTMSCNIRIIIGTHNTRHEPI